MKRFYIQVNSPDGIANFIIRHKSVTNENEAKERLLKKYNFIETDILRLSDKRLPTNYLELTSERIQQLAVLVQQLLHSRDEGEFIGSLCKRYTRHTRV